MFRSMVSVAGILMGLLVLSTRSASATCLACPNCIYEPLPNDEGNACLNYWTCSGETITCYYPSTADPGTFVGCEYTGYGSPATFTLTSSSPSVCADSYIGDNSKCEPSNNPWNVPDQECTASEGDVGEPNSGLL